MTKLKTCLQKKKFEDEKETINSMIDAYLLMRKYKNKYDINTHIINVPDLLFERRIEAYNYKNILKDEDIKKQYFILKESKKSTDSKYDPIITNEPSLSKYDNNTNNNLNENKIGDVLFDKMIYFLTNSKDENDDTAIRLYKFIVKRIVNTMNNLLNIKYDDDDNNILDKFILIFIKTVLNGSLYPKKKEEISTKYDSEKIIFNSFEITPKETNDKIDKELCDNIGDGLSYSYITDNKALCQNLLHKEFNIYKKELEKHDVNIYENFDGFFLKFIMETMEKVLQPLYDDNISKLDRFLLNCLKKALFDKSHSDYDNNDGIYNLDEITLNKRLYDLSSFEDDNEGRKLDEFIFKKATIFLYLDKDKNNKDRIEKLGQFIVKLLGKCIK